MCQMREGWPLMRQREKGSVAVALLVLAFGGTCGLIAVLLCQ